jgi:hypothetical protein
MVMPMLDKVEDYCIFSDKSLTNENIISFIEKI